MKKVLLIFVFSLSFNIFASGFHSKDRELLQDIKIETKKCAVQVVNTKNNTPNIVGYKSVCNTLQIINQTEAKLLLDGTWVMAVISESKESDGGDLDDLTVYSMNGKILATKTNIPAYDNIIVAMAGDSDFSQKEER